MLECLHFSSQTFSGELLQRTEHRRSFPTIHEPRKYTYRWTLIRRKSKLRSSEWVRWWVIEPVIAPVTTNTFPISVRLEPPHPRVTALPPCLLPYSVPPPRILVPASRPSYPRRTEFTHSSITSCCTFLCQPTVVPAVNYLSHRLPSQCL